VTTLDPAAVDPAAIDPAAAVTDGSVVEVPSSESTSTSTEAPQRAAPTVTAPPEQRVQVSTPSDLAQQRLSWIIAALVGLALVIALVTAVFWRITRPGDVDHTPAMRWEAPVAAEPALFASAAAPAAAATGAVGGVVVGANVASGAIAETDAAAPLDPVTEPHAVVWDVPPARPTARAEWNPEQQPGGNPQPAAPAAPAAESQPAPQLFGEPQPALFDPNHDPFPPVVVEESTLIESSVVAPVVAPVVPSPQMAPAAEPSAGSWASAGWGEDISGEDAGQQG